MIERKCEITPSFSDLSRPLVNTMRDVKPRFRQIQEKRLDANGDLLTRGTRHLRQVRVSRFARQDLQPN
jgi:hypothetical protein